MSAPPWPVGSVLVVEGEEARVERYVAKGSYVDLHCARGWTVRRSVGYVRAHLTPDLVRWRL